MAELDRAYHFPGVEDIQVEVDMMDFAYVEACTEWKKLMKVLQVLTSGKEGHYPELVKAAEEKMLSLMPQKEKKKYLTLTKLKASPQEVMSAEEDLLNWMKQTSALDAKLATKTIVADDFNDFPHLHLLNKNQQARIADARKLFKWENISTLQRDYRAETEKKKGNECFKAGDYDDAVKFYTHSIALNCYNSASWCNRALVHLKKELYELAEMDCNVALALDPMYVKALLRRGTTRISLGKYKEAAYDLRETMRLSPETSRDTEKLLQKALQKYREVEGKELVFEDEDVMEEEEEEDGEDCIEIPIRISTNIPIEMEEEEEEEEVKVQVVKLSGDVVVVTNEHVSNLSDLLVPLLEVDLLQSGVLQAKVEEEVEMEEEGTEEEKNAEVATAAQKKGEFVRVMIEEEDSEEEEDEDAEEIPINIHYKENGEDKKDEENEEDHNNLINKINIVEEEKEDEEEGKDLFVKAIELMQQKDFANAEIKLAQFLNQLEASSGRDSRELVAHYYRAACATFMSDFPQVFVELQSILGKDANNAWVRKLQQLVSSHATSQLSQYFASDEDEIHLLLTSDHYKDLGSKAVEKKDYRLAVEKYSLALIVDLQNSAALNNRALAYLRSDDYVPAIGDASRVLQMCSCINTTDSEGVEANKQMKIKAHYRRAEARYKFALSLNSKHNQKEFVDEQKDSLESASEDIAALIALGSNTTATVKLHNDIVKLQQSLLPIPEAPKQPTPLVAAPPPAPIAISTTTKLPTETIPQTKEITETPSVPTTSSTAAAATESISQPLLPPLPPAAQAPVAAEKKEKVAVSKGSLKDVDIVPITPVKSIQSEAVNKASVSKTKTPSSASKKATPGKVVVNVPVACPTEPPKTGFEFERHWRNLHGHNEQKVNYLKLFKASTYRKVFKESSSSENFSFILRTLSEDSLAVESSLLLDVLNGVAQSKAFDMILMLLPQEDLDHLQKIFTKLSSDISLQSSKETNVNLSELQKKYNCCNK